MSPKRVSGKRNSLQRVHLPAMRPAEPAQLAIELAPPDFYLQATATAVPSPPSWRDGTDSEAVRHRRSAAPGQPLGGSVIEIDLT